MKYYLSIDIGGTALKYSLMDAAGNIAERGEIPSPQDRESFQKTITDLYEKYADRIEALVMSAPGRIDSAHAYFYTSGALQYLDHTSLKELLKDVPVPIALENDAKAAALAEIWKGSMQGIRNGSLLVIGTGLGGAVIIDGKLYRGLDFTAGEYSFLSGDFHQPYSLNNLVGTEGVGSLLRRYAAKTEEDPEKLNGRIFFARAVQGEQAALDALHEYCSVLAGLILSLQAVLDVQRFAIGGGISRQPLLIDVLKEEVHQGYERGQGILPFTEPEITACTFGNDANMIGALYHYLFELN